MHTCKISIGEEIIKDPLRTNKDKVKFLIKIYKEKGQWPDETKNNQAAIICRRIRWLYKKGKLEKELIDALNFFNFAWTKQ